VYKDQGQAATLFGSIQCAEEAFAEMNTDGSKKVSFREFAGWAITKLSQRVAMQRMNACLRRSFSASPATTEGDDTEQENDDGGAVKDDTDATTATSTNNKMRESIRPMSVLPAGPSVQEEMTVGSEDEEEEEGEGISKLVDDDDDNDALYRTQRPVYKEEPIQAGNADSSIRQLCHDILDASEFDPKLLPTEDASSSIEVRMYQQAKRIGVHL
jgi:hypothetical protein